MLFSSVIVARLYIALPVRWKLYQVGMFDKLFLFPNAGRSGGGAKVMAVLGSGGHTTEMLHLLTKFDAKRNCSALIYVIASSDFTSRVKVEAAAGSLRPHKYIKIPRSREVGQSWLSSAFSSVFAAIFTLHMMAAELPDLVVCNGPGTCVPVCLVAFIFRLLGVKRIKIVFCESFCRVTSLSLTGRLLYPIADRFVVMWPHLLNRYPRAEYLGVII